MKLSTRRLVFSAAVAAVYAALTIALAGWSYGPIQLRVAEALCILPFFFPQTAVGLFVGCILANLLSPSGLLDVIFGSLATLFCVLCILWGRKRFKERIWPARIFTCVMPVIWNAVIVGAMLAYLSAPPELYWHTFAIYALEVAAGEAIVMFVLGLPLMIWLPKTRVYKELCRLYQP